MPYYVYILQSDFDNSYYKGYSENVFQRLLQHNSGDSEYTKNKIPWRLVYYEEHANKKSALIREKNLKKATRARIEALVSSTKNLIK